MNQLIVYPLLILMVLGAFCQLFYATNPQNVDFTYSGTLEGQASQGNQTINEEQSQYTGEAQDAVFDVNMTTGIIALIIGLVVVGVVAGIRILGSGISEHSVKLIYNSTTYYGLWGIFSALAFPVFLEVQSGTGFGLFLWLGLTLVYSLGFFETLHGGTVA